MEFTFVDVYCSVVNDRTKTVLSRTRTRQLFDGSSQDAVMNMNLLTATDSTEKSNTAEN